MVGFSVVLVAILVMIAFAIVFMMVGIMATIMFIVATILTILFIVKSEERKASGKKLGGKVAIPVVLYLISIPILILMGSFIFSFIATNHNISDNIQYYDRDKQNNKYIKSILKHKGICYNINYICIRRGDFYATSNKFKRA